MTYELLVSRPVRDEGSIVIFEGVDVESGRTIRFAADHRPAQDIVEALECGEDVRVEIEAWAIVGSHI